MAMNLPTYIPLEEAARRYGLSRDVLTRLIEDGKIRAANVNGGIAVTEEDIHIMALQSGSQRDKDLEGHPIRLSRAAEKYQVSDANLVRWVEAGYIQVIERGPKLLMLDEADVQLTTAIFKQARKKTGSFVKAGWVLKRAMEHLQAA